MSDKIALIGTAIEFAGSSTAIELALPQNGKKINRRQEFDEAAGIIYGAKIAGLKSINPGYMVGIDAGRFGAASQKPYRYSREDMKRNAANYNGVSFYDNHAPLKQDPATGKRVIADPVRSNGDFLGTLENSEFIETGDPEVDGIYADIRLLQEGEKYKRTAAIVRNFNTAFRLSHEVEFRNVRIAADGHPELCDLQRPAAVALTNHTGGTTSTVWESAGTPLTKMTFAEVAGLIEPSHPFRGKAIELSSKPEMAGLSTGIDSGSQVDSSKAVDEAFVTAITFVLRDSNLTPDQQLESITMLFKMRQTLMGADGGASGGAGNGGAQTPATQGKAPESAGPIGPTFDVAIECAGLLAENKIPFKESLVRQLGRMANKQERETFIRELKEAFPTAGTAVEAAGPVVPAVVPAAIPVRAGSLPAVEPAAIAGQARSIEPATAVEAAGAVAATPAAPAKKETPWSDVLKGAKSPLRRAPAAAK